MLNAIIAYSIRHKLVVALCTLALIVVGTYQATRLPIDAVPDITNNQVLVITSAPSLGAGDIERILTFPIELATRNIAGIQEQRSFSRFGLSLVTLVFNDQTDVYWARQQVAERLATVSSEIPPGIGKPTLAPVTTGLGEIFQYVLRPKPGFEQRFTPMELRTLQDWTVRRQLLSVPGIADVSSFGGKLRQYEIAVQPDKLHAHGVSIAELMQALESQNQNTGGAYIEKGPTALYIRTEGLIQNQTDIENCLIKKQPNGQPLLLRDLATVQTGMATRYGAICYNDQGEVAGGLVMMLKGENSNQVIQSVKAKIKEIESTLPEGVLIEAFLDRTKMVNNAIHTVRNNLLEGALIVVLVLVLFLGNLRAGLVVASVIPLSMLFAISLMNLFGVSGNLMSLGALDFGLIVDGAVIIVEAVMHRLHQDPRFKDGSSLSQSDMDQTVAQSAGRMMNAAVFGQIIILIVYLPILTLQGIEGKMFKPMAQTVAFALLGAFLLSITYVPMASAWLLSKKINHRANFADRMMKGLEKAYQQTWLFFWKKPAFAVVPTLLAFVVSLFLLSKLGGEFIPELEEGDFAVDTRVLTGSSLQTTIHYTQKAAKLLLERYPEVEKVVTKIGSGEIPTDPMPMEASDMMVILAPKSEWKSARSFDELAARMSETLSEIPGISTGFQFPVQMRFNELMTGGRQDVVCKIFGNDLDSLARYAQALGALARQIEGSVDVYVETVTGVPQIVVRYNRAAMAQHGVSIETVNQTIQAAYAGATCGQVYEGERRFDLVVRLNPTDRNRWEEIQDLWVPTAQGNSIPLRQVAEVRTEEGPNQIQREDAQRRITVGFNVRGKDIQGVVEALKKKTQAQITLPPNYRITYGGSFQNLQEAKQRLWVAVPLALLLILVLLYFALQSISQALLIFTAIPLSAIGGILALWLRGLPFSISAAVGFIALFGVAVLNGIVLITAFNQLLKEKKMDMQSLLLTGTQSRLRPVLMTALVASLGFLPMAISRGAGGEVQRPLATVVIGGLVSATLLTLYLLPILYGWLMKKKLGKISVLPLLIGLCLTQTEPLIAQDSKLPRLSLSAAIDSNLRNALVHQIQAQQIRIDQTLEQSAREWQPLTVGAEYGNINSPNLDTRFSVTQTFPAPQTLAQQKKWNQLRTANSRQQAEWIRYHQQYEITTLYYQWQVAWARQQLWKKVDSLLLSFAEQQANRLAAGETDALELRTAALLQWQAQQKVAEVEMERSALEGKFNLLIQCRQFYQPAPAALQVSWPLAFDTSQLSSHPALKSQVGEVLLAQQKATLEKSKQNPAFSLGYNNLSFAGEQRQNGQWETYTGAKRFHTVNASVAIPLFNAAPKYRAEAALKEANQQTLKSAQLSLEYEQTARQYNQRLRILQSALQNYQRKLGPTEQRLFQLAEKQLLGGQINRVQWLLIVQQEWTTEDQYLQLLSQYNQLITEQYYLLNKSFL